jgi:hypothetical protein
MKKTILFVAIVATLFSCNGKKQEVAKNSDWLAENLQGKVEQTTTTDYKTDSLGNIGEQDSCCLVTMKYDEKGYITEYSSNNKAGSDKLVETITHYDNGATKTIKDFKNGNQNLEIKITIDKDGKYKSALEYDSASKLTYYYTDITENDYGALTSMKKYNADSTLSSTISRTYGNSIPTGGEDKDSTGKITQSSAIKLDDKNNMVEYALKDVTKDSTTNKITQYKYDSYDDKGNWTQRTKMDESGKPLQIRKREITYYKD